MKPEGGQEDDLLETAAADPWETDDSNQGCQCPSVVSIYIFFYSFASEKRICMGSLLFGDVSLGMLAYYVISLNPTCSLWAPRLKFYTECVKLFKADPEPERTPESVLTD